MDDIFQTFFRSDWFSPEGVLVLLFFLAFLLQTWFCYDSKISLRHFSDFFYYWLFSTLFHSSFFFLILLIILGHFYSENIFQTFLRLVTLNRLFLKTVTFNTQIFFRKSFFYKLTITQTFFRLNSLRHFSDHVFTQTFFRLFWLGDLIHQGYIFTPTSFFFTFFTTNTKRETGLAFKLVTITFFFDRLINTQTFFTLYNNTRTFFFFYCFTQTFFSTFLQSDIFRQPVFTSDICIRTFITRTFQSGDSFLNWKWFTTSVHFSDFFYSEILWQTFLLDMTFFRGDFLHLVH